MLDRPQRIIALRVAMACRSVSTRAALVISGLIPAHIMAIESSGIFNGRKVGNLDTAEIRNRTHLKWQEQEVWDTSYTDHWMHRLIWDVKQWVIRKFGDSNFHITLITSHGCFSQYLHKFKKLNDPKCVNSVANSNDAEHTLFQCDRWWRHRR